MVLKLALVGQTDTNWRNEVWKKYKENGEVYISYTYRITRHEELLRKQIAESPERMLRIYFYHSKKGGGAGQVVDVGYVDSFVTGHMPSETPNEQLTPPADVGQRIYKTWLHIKQLKEISPPIDVLFPRRNPFRDFDSNAALVPSQVRNSFAYVVDIGDSGDQPVTREVAVEKLLEAAPDEGAIDEDTLSIILPESFIESLVAFRTQMLGLGDLTLIGQQVNTPHGRLDLVFEDEGGKVVIVEFKKGNMSARDIIQLKDYMSWASSVYEGKSIKGILFCHGFSPRQRNAIEMDKAHGYDIEIKTYECLFTIK